ncbi:hypothetical protein KFE25_005070 [Diacronema lutheri]|uniref:Uncharacterized protein n=1 Tax=Diacronema lutheri TaxID=2081491 RepID=A0A8J6C1A5_DIALT|nr:hypothetical protein KFE25_005070 [Diacronema lutheri]
MAFHYIVRDLASLPGGQSLTRSLPDGLGAEEGCCMTARGGIASLPKRRNAKRAGDESLLPIENIGEMCKNFTLFLQRQSEPKPSKSLSESLAVKAAENLQRYLLDLPINLSTQ